MSTGLGRHALRHGVAATLAPQPMLRRLNPSVVVDVGANRGQFALDVRQAAPQARILSFEPLPSEADVFRTIFLGQRNVELIEAALGSSKGSAKLHVAGAADSSSLLQIGRLQEQLFPGTGEVNLVEVKVDVLDEVLREVDLADRALLKIDVQGYELEVLKGALNSLSRFRWVYVELSFVELYVSQPLAHEVMALLVTHGFGIVDAGSPTRSKGRTIQQDYLFERHATLQE
jgi:FkbM family methyltransferase